MNEAPGLKQLPSLPNEIWAEIFSYLPPSTTIKICSLVCKAWAQHVRFTRFSSVTVNDPSLFNPARMHQTATTWPYILGIEYRHVLPLVDISGLAAYQAHLKELDLSESDVRDISVLSHCLQLTSVDLAHTRVTDLAPLGRCVQLRQLNARSCKIKSLESLSACVNLTSIDVQYTPTRDISALASCPNLRKVDVRGTPLDEISALLGCRKLHTVDLSLTYVEDVSPLGGSASTLVSLNLYRTPVVAIDALAGCVVLQKAFFQGCASLGSVAPLKECPQLKRVDLKNTPVLDHDFLAHKPGMEFLRLPSGDILIGSL